MKTGKKLSLCALLILLQPFCTMFGMKRSSSDSPAPDCIEQSPLHHAAWYGNTISLARLLKTHDCNQQIGPWGATPLFIAAENGHADIAQRLLATGADIDKAMDDGTTPLFIAAQNGHTTIVKLLLANGAHPNIATNHNGTTPLFIAAQNGHAGIVQTLLDAGADINKATTDNGTTPLYIAAQNGHAGIVQTLLDAGADINKATTTEATPLFIAAQDGCTDIVQILLAAGADKDKARTDGATPLFSAANNGHVNIIRMLLCADADYNARLIGGRRITPLQYTRSIEARTVLEQWPTRRTPTLQLLEGIAANTCTIDRLQELMRDDAQLHSYAIGHRMATPLFLATCNKNAALMRELLRLGADPTITDAHGETPIHYAVQTPILLGLFGMIAIEQKTAKSRKEKQLHMQEFIEYWNPKFSQPQE